jgi:Na+/melibiose symporter-like transporter
MAVLTKSHAFSLYSVFTTFAVVAALIAFQKWAKSRSEVITASRARHFHWRLLLLPSDGRTRRLLGVHALASVASALPAILVLWFVRDRLQGSEQATGIFLILYFGAALLGMATWTPLARRWGKAEVWTGAMALTVAAFAWALFLNNGDLVAYGFVCVGSGLALGGELVLPASILSDYLPPENNEGQAGRSYAWLSMIPQLALGVSAAIAFPILDAVGFSTGHKNSNTALFTLVLLYAGLPSILKTISVLLCWKWRPLLTPTNNNENKNRNTMVVGSAPASTHSS